MALVLPMSGVQQYFCTMTMVFMDCVDSCPVETRKDFCQNEETQNPERPECLTAAKFLPDADLTGPSQIPVIKTDGMFLEIVAFGEIADDQFEAFFPLRHRGPPDQRRTYVVQRRLLI